MTLSLRLRLSAMMFLQFMMLPAWFNTVVPYVRTLPGGENWVMWCGTLLVVGAQMYVDDHAPAELRNQAQGLIMTLMTSLGAFASVSIFDKILQHNALSSGLHDWTVPYLVALILSIVVTVAMAVLRDRRRLS